MNTHIESIRFVGSGVCSVVVRQDFYSRKNGRLSSTTTWTHKVTDMPTIDAYHSNNPRESKTAEKNLIRMVKWRGVKEIVKHYH